MMNALIQTIASLQHSDRPMAYLQDGLRTYAQFYQDVQRMAQHVYPLPQSHWALWLEDGYDFAVSFLALAWAGKTILLPPNRIAQTETWLQEQGIDFWEGLHQTPTIPILADSTLPQWAHIDWDNAPVVLFTSGSTGAPKRIARTLRQFMCELDILHSVFAWPANSLVIASVSHQHMFGLFYKVLLTLQQGCAFVAAQCTYPEDLIQWQTHSHGPKIFISSPAFLSRWQEADAAKHYAHIFSAGGPLPSHIPEQLGHDVIEILGSSESGGIAWRHAPKAWQIFSNVGIRIDDIQQLWVQAPHAHTTDWISTGDRAHWDGQHHLQLLGRMDRMVKLEEKRLSLTAIEAAIDQQAGIEQSHACLIAKGEQSQLAAVCTLTPEGWAQLRSLGKKAFVQQLKNQLRHQLEAMALPKRWRFELALPCNSQSKLDHASVQQLFVLHPRPVSRLISQTAQQAQLALWFPPELQCFQGHFPGQPIYPGVGQLDCVQHHARQLWFPEAVCVGMEQLKFQKIIEPYDQLFLSLERLEHKVHFKISSEMHTVATGRLCFQQTSEH